jgi:hypothetical protein
MMRKAWYVEVWETPTPQYRDAHERCRAMLAAEGNGETIYCGTVEAVGRITEGIRRSQASADALAARYAEQYPNAYIIRSTGGTL